MLIVGLTGGIATGKSTVSSSLQKKHKLRVVDADLIAKEIVEPGQRAYRQILRTFGFVPNLVNEEDGTLNRAALGQAVFGDRKLLAQLNAIVHPAVKRAMFWQIFKAYIQFQQVVILDVPLLFETGLNMICGITIATTCPPEIQMKRLRERNPELSVEDCRQRVESQMSNEERNYRADLVIDNSLGLEELEDSISSVVKEIRPSLCFTLLDLFPPFGVCSAVFTFLLRVIRDRFKGTKPPKKSN